MHTSESTRDQCKPSASAAELIPKMGMGTGHDTVVLERALGWLTVLTNLSHR